MNKSECMTTDEHGRQLREYGSCNQCGMGEQSVPERKSDDECDECILVATTIVEIHDAAAPTTGLTWHEAKLCDGCRDELVENIRSEDPEYVELTIEGMVSIEDRRAQLTKCEAAS